MPEINILEGYPQPIEPRFVAKNLRTINHRITAARRDKEFFDGDRNFGYGGYEYDGRWLPIAKKIIRHYKLKNSAHILHLNCEKGFLLHDLKKTKPSLEVVGTETSNYAIENALKEVKASINKVSSVKLPFPDNSFDFVIGLSFIYTHSLPDAIEALQEINRVCNGSSFVTLATYETDEEYFLFKDWTLLGTLLLKRDEWKTIMKRSGYKGDFYFISSKSLNLVRQN